MSLTKNQIKLIRSLQVKKYRDNEKLFVVEGPKMINELLQQERYRIEHIFHTEEFEVPIPDSIDTTIISNKDLERISGLKSPNQVLATVHFLSEDIASPNGTTIIALDDVKDPGNLGTIIRTAIWFGIHHIMMSKDSVDPYNPKVLQASMGAFFKVHLSQIDLSSSLLDLKSKGYSILGTFMDGENVFEMKSPEKMVLVMGSESHGISDALETCIDTKITIPKLGEGESLNVAMATGICVSALLKG